MQFILKNYNVAFVNSQRSLNKSPVGITMSLHPYFFDVILYFLRYTGFIKKYTNLKSLSVSRSASMYDVLY